MNALVQFYRGTHPDDQGRFLADILQQDDDWLDRIAPVHSLRSVPQARYRCHGVKAGRQHQAQPWLKKLSTKSAYRPSGSFSSCSRYTSHSGL